MSWNEELRSQFPVTGLCTYLDSAYDCGGSLIGKAAAARYFEEWASAAAAAKRGGPGREPFFAAQAETREYIGQILGGVPARNVTITKNTNEGFNIIMQGYDFQPGDNIVTYDWEHSSILVPTMHAIKDQEVEIRFTTMGRDRIPSLEDLWAKVDDRTVMVLVSYVQSLSGYKMDLAELGKRCREKGIFLIVDGIQGVGLSEFHAEEWNVSAVTGGAYKGLGAFISIGYLYICDELMKRVQPTYVAYNNQIMLDHSEPIPKMIYTDELNAEKYDNSSSNLLGTYVFHDSLKKILEIGIDKIEKYVLGLLDQLYEGFQKLGYQITTPAERARRCATLCIKTENSKEIFQYFMENQVVTTDANGYVRMSLGAYSNSEDVRKALDIAKTCPWR